MQSVIVSSGLAGIDKQLVTRVSFIARLVDEFVAEAVEFAGYFLERDQTEGVGFLRGFAERRPNVSDAGDGFYGDGHVVSVVDSVHLKLTIGVYFVYLK